MQVPSAVEVHEARVSPLRPQRHAAELGLGALFISMTVMLLFPILLIVLFLGDALAWNASLRASDLDLAINGGYATAITVLVLAVLGLLFGLVGLVSGLFRRQPLGLSVAGILMGIGAVILAVILFLTTQRIGEDLRMLQDRIRHGHRPGGNMDQILPRDRRP